MVNVPFTTWPAIIVSGTTTVTVLVAIVMGTVIEPAPGTVTPVARPDAPSTEAQALVLSFFHDVESMAMSRMS